jgi:hypothetical protein
VSLQGRCAKEGATIRLDLFPEKRFKNTQPKKEKKSQPSNASLFLEASEIVGAVLTILAVIAGGARCLNAK